LQARIAFYHFVLPAKRIDDLQRVRASNSLKRGTWRGFPKNQLASQRYRQQSILPRDIGASFCANHFAQTNAFNKANYR